MFSIRVHISTLGLTTSTDDNDIDHLARGSGMARERSNESKGSVERDELIIFRGRS